MNYTWGSPKPKELKYTDMAIWVDEHAYTKDCDDEQLFVFLYWLSQMLSKKRRLFRSNATYDDFCMFYAGNLYARLKDDKPHGKDGHKLPQIKSILNYMKTTIFGHKKKFEEFNLINEEEPEAEEDTESNYYMHSIVSSEVDGLLKVEIGSYLHDICRTARAFLSSSPYVKNRVLWNNIYLSCILTIINGVTLSVGDKKYFNSLAGYEKARMNFLCSCYERERESPAILYHVPEKMRGYVEVQAKRIRHKITEDLSGMIRVPLMNEDTMRGIMYNDIRDKEDSDDEC